MAYDNITLEPGQHGFWINYPNGYMLSVQYGKGNYCDNRDSSPGAWDTDHHDLGATANCEIGIFNSDHKLIQIGNDTVAPYVPIFRLPAIMLAVQSGNEDSMRQAILGGVNTITLT